MRWNTLYLTVEEGLASLATLCVLKPEPRQNNKQMLTVLDITLPHILPDNHAS